MIHQRTGNREIFEAGAGGGRSAKIAKIEKERKKIKYNPTTMNVDNCPIDLNT